MTIISPLEKVMQKGLFGNHEGKDEDGLIRIKETTNLLIVQIVQYKQSILKAEEILSLIHI